MKHIPGQNKIDFDFDFDFDVSFWEENWKSHTPIVAGKVFEMCTNLVCGIAYGA